MGERHRTLLRVVHTTLLSTMGKDNVQCLNVYSGLAYRATVCRHTQQRYPNVSQCKPGNDAFIAVVLAQRKTPYFLASSSDWTSASSSKLSPAPTATRSPTCTVKPPVFIRLRGTVITEQTEWNFFFTGSRGDSISTQCMHWERDE